jgi:hypothetical protein
MIPQNLDVYETFQVHRVSPRKLFLINWLSIDSNGFPAPIKVAEANELVRYAIDLRGQSLLDCRPAPITSPVISSGELHAGGAGL